MPEGGLFVVDHMPEPPSAHELAVRERDVLAATWEERRWTRRRARTRKGRELALALPTGTVLEPGVVVFVGDDFYVIVEALPEAVIAVTTRSHPEAVRTAFEVGNRHFPLALDGDRLLVPDDTAMEQLLQRLGVPWEKTQAVFSPLGAGHGHARGRSPADGHSHGHSHED